MITLIIILTMLAVVLAIALAVSIKEGTAYDDDRSYRDKDGDHVYYDKSLIEKKRFSRIHPKRAVRTFTGLFRRK